MTDEQIALLQMQQDIREIKVDLRHHIYRTDLLEEAQTDLTKRVTPLEHHVAAWGGVGKALVVVGAIAALLKVFYDLFLR